jgi:hypothetical protein
MATSKRVPHNHYGSASFIVAHGSVSKHIFAGALQPEVFAHVAGLYRQLKEHLGIAGTPVPAQVAEDETKIDPLVEFDRATNTLVGFCGAGGVDHKCTLADARVRLPHDSSGE